MDFQPRINKIFRNSVFAAGVIIFILYFLNCNIRLSENEFKLLALLSSLLLLGIFMFFWGWELFGIKSMIENIPTSKIRSLPMGIVELKGDALAKYPLETKLNGINCVFYKYKVEKLVVTGYGKNRRRAWQEIAGGQSITPFYIKDSTGSVLIEPFSCDAELERKYYHSEGNYDGAKRYSEWYISPGEKLYVIGYAGKSGDIMAQRKEKLLTRLKEIRGSAEEREKYDLNQDGRLDDYEWITAVEDIKKAIALEEGTDGLCDVAVSGRDKDKMLISDKSEKELLSRFALKSFSFIFGGIIIFSVSSYFLLALLRSSGLITN
ncbi:E3 ubiquitin ligase family protein [bacterium]|nr:hypothetical protein [bacterium]MBU3956470.1 E3 ubiquitin ligase family protein [bacterium]MBU4133760.1 E3 ubiquitin ligase family protein [bacterium]